MSAKRIGFVAGAVAMLVGAPARATGLDPNFLEGGGYAITTDDADLTSLAWAPDGSQRLFVTRKGGQVYVIQDRVRTPDPFYDFTPVYDSSECGVLAIAFDPDYGTNHFVYFFVTLHDNEQEIIRLRDEGNLGVDRTTIIAGLPTRGVNHDGGALGFGPDGKLYWAIGDNGEQSSVLGDMSTLKSKIGRANRDGTLPTDNPFDDGSGPNNDFIWARNFRNPFTMTFQPDTGRLWLDVVGTYFEQVFAVRAGDDGGWPQYEYNAPGGVLRPVVKYRTNGADGTDGDDRHTVTSATRASGKATFTVTALPTPADPYLVPGEEVTIAGVGDASFNGVFHIDELVGSDGFRVTQPGPDATSNGGTMALTHIGGCITGGTFLDSTAASAEYRGNFFFGDFNTGNIERVRVEGDRVLSVTRFSVGNGSIVDIDTGPDGALYWIRHDGNGEVYRAVFVSTTQGLVVSHANVRMLERGVAAFNVHLAMAPSAPVEVSVARASGDRDVTVTEGETLEFGTTDWATPKVVRVAAAGDVDGTDDVTELSVSAASLGPERVTVRVVDEYRSPDVGEGGAGGEAGAGGVPEGGAGPEGGTSGSSGTGGLGGSAGRGDGGQAGLGEAGQGTGAEGSGGKKSGSDSSSGCGCAVSHRSGSSALLLVLGSYFLRRRLRLRR